MNRSWAISSTLACLLLAGTFVWAKEPKRNNPPRRENAPHVPQPHIPNAGRNAGTAPHSVPNPNANVNANVTQPNTSGFAGDSKAAHPNDAKAPRVGEPRMGANAPGGLRPGEGLARLQEMSPSDQEKALNSNPEFQRMPPEQKQKLRKQLDDFNHLPPAQKDQIIRRMQAWEQLTPAQKDQARGLQQRMQAVPEDRRKMMQTALRSLRQMDPEERERVMNSDRFKGMFNDNERDLMRGIADLPIGKPQADANPPASQPQPK